MNMMFSGCLSLKNLNISNFKINKDTDTSNMFFECPKLKKTPEIKKITGEKEKCICI